MATRTRKAPNGGKRAKAKNQVEPGAANVKFVGRTLLSNKKFEEMDAPAFVTVSKRRIDLPSDDEQKAGFYLPAKDASDITRMYPHLWKVLKAKG